MDMEISARLFAIEILIANLIAERLRGTPDSAEVSGRALKMILDQIAELPLSGPDEGMHSVIRSQIGDATASVMKMALERAVT
jgi:hypothetical protein